MAQGHRFKSEWPSEALSGAPRPHSGRIDPFANPSANGCYLRILFSNGVKGGRLFVVDALGCLRSLRARLALDGVSWVQGGSVEIAVGQRLADATISAPSSAPSLRRRSSWELDAVSCLVD